jgi:hypothetical protein
MVKATPAEINSVGELVEGAHQYNKKHAGKCGYTSHRYGGTRELECLLSYAADISRGISFQGADRSFSLKARPQSVIVGSLKVSGGGITLTCTFTAPKVCKCQRWASRNKVQSVQCRRYEICLKTPSVARKCQLLCFDIAIEMKVNWAGGT